MPEPEEEEGRYTKMHPHQEHTGGGVMLRGSKVDVAQDRGLLLVTYPGAPSSCVSLVLVCRSLITDQ